MNKSEDKVINAVQLLTIEPDEELQRIDNYLLTKLKAYRKFNLPHYSQRRSARQ